MIPDGVAWDNPVTDSLVIPRKTQRDRVMTLEEYCAAVEAGEALLEEVKPDKRYGQSKQRQLLVILLAMETARWPGEIRRLERKFIDYENSTAFLPDTKVNRHDSTTHEGQTFGLSDRVMRLLAMAEALAGDSPSVFPADTACGHVEKIDRMWKAIRQRADIDDEVVL